MLPIKIAEIAHNITKELENSYGNFDIDSWNECHKSNYITAITLVRSGEVRYPCELFCKLHSLTRVDYKHLTQREKLRYIILFATINSFINDATL